MCKNYTEYVLKYFCLVTDTVLKLIPMCTEAEIILSVKNWLRHASKRHENRYDINKFTKELITVSEPSITQIGR